MNIDERIEALVQSVELLASFHKDNEKLMRESQQSTEKQLKRLGKYVHTIAGLVLDHDAGSAHRRRGQRSRRRVSTLSGPTGCNQG